MAMKRVRFRVDLAPGCAIGPGKIALLEAIDAEGSLSAAARSLGMSYRRAWLLLMALNESFTRPVAATSVGGRNGGGVTVTALGHQLVREFRQFEGDVERLSARRWRSLTRAARPVPGHVAAKPVRKAAGRTRTRMHRTSDK